MNSSSAAPEIIAIAGVDGSGKTTLTDWLQEELRARGHAPGFVWSRFNNYLSLPFLAATRVTGHNIYRDHEGVRMGFHDFEALPKPLLYMFVGLQAVDVNIATLFKINIPTRRIPVTICERGPWDTLVDVAADTGMDGLARMSLYKMFSGQISRRTAVVLVDRDADMIEKCRPELRFDTKLRRRQQLYRQLAAVGGWTVIDNNGDLKDTKQAFVGWLESMGY